MARLTGLSIPEVQAGSHRHSPFICARARHHRGLEGPSYVDRTARWRSMGQHYRKSGNGDRWHGRRSDRHGGGYDCAESPASYRSRYGCGSPSWLGRRHRVRDHERAVAGRDRSDLMPFPKPFSEYARSASEDPHSFFTGVQMSGDFAEPTLQPAQERVEHRTTSRRPSCASTDECSTRTCALL